MYDTILPYNDEEIFTLRDLQQIIGDPDSSSEIKIKDISQSELFWHKEGVFLSLSRRYNKVRSGENDCYVLNIETKIRKIAYFEPMGFLEAIGNNMFKFESTTREIQWEEDQSSEPYYETEWLKNFCNE